MKTIAEINLLAKAMRPTIEAAIKESTDEIMTAKQVAAMLGVTPNAIYNRVANGEIPYKKTGGRLFFSRNQLNKYFLGQ